MRSKYLQLILICLQCIFCLSLGCEKESPISSKHNQERKITFLRTKTATQAEPINLKKLITVKDGGRMLIKGSGKENYEINFKPTDVSKDVEIGFVWDPERYEAEFSPHGLLFNHPVEIKFTYTNAELDKNEEQKLSIYYYNEDDNAWENIGGKVDTNEKIVTGYITHFSRYAIGAE